MDIVSASYLLETDKLNDYAKPLYEKQTTMTDWKLQQQTKEKENPHAFS